MSVVSSYARLSTSQLENLRTKPDGLASLHKDCPAGGAVLYLDKASGVISWLLSPCKRAEQIRFAAEIESVMNDKEVDNAQMPSVPPLDELLIAIEGRGPNKDERLSSGLGPACVFQPDDVVRFDAVLSKVDISTLRRELNFPLMDTLHLPLDYWQEEGEEIFVEYLVPLFEKLKQLYADAAKANQHVLVWWS